MTSPQNIKSAYSREDLELCGTGGLFGTDTGKLPTGNMLMIDRIVNIDNDGGSHGKGSITAELDIHPDLWFFDCHFPGDPVMPGCLGLDAMWQLVGFFLGWRGNPGRGRALGCGEVKFSGQILPSATKTKGKNVCAINVFSSSYLTLSFVILTRFFLVDCNQ